MSSVHFDADWIQAIGSIAAILVSILLVLLGNVLQVREQNRVGRLKFEQQTDSLKELFSFVFDDLNGLCDDPDDEHALAEHWRKKSFDSVSIQLERIKYDLDQLKALSPFDTPAFGSVQDVAYSLIVVKDALEREDSGRPIDAAGRQRVARYAFETKPLWGKAFIRANAIVERTRARRLGKISAR